MKLFYIFAFSALSVLNFACGAKIPSSEISTKALYFTMAIQHQDNSSVECYVRASVKDELGNSVEMTGSDYFTCNGEALEKGNDALGSYVYYHKRVALNLNSGYSIAFYKDGKFFGSGFVKAPEKIQILEPALNYLIRQNEQLKVSWIPTKVEDVYMTIIQSVGYKLSQESVSRTVSTRVSDSDASALLPSFASLGDINLPQTNLTTQLFLTRFKRGQISANMSGHIDAVESISMTGQLMP